MLNKPTDKIIPFTNNETKIQTTPNTITTPVMNSQLMNIGKYLIILLIVIIILYMYKNQPDVTSSFFMQDNAISKEISSFIQKEVKEVVKESAKELIAEATPSKLKIATWVCVGFFGLILVVIVGNKVHDDILNFAIDTAAKTIIPKN